MYDLIVIGAGPAGVSASIYACSRGLKVLVLEKNVVGGVIGAVSSVTHYTSVDKDETGITFAAKMKDQLLNAGAELIIDEVVEIKFSGNVKEVITKEKSYEAKAIIIANGSMPKKLDIEGASKFFGKTFSINAQKTGELHKGKNMYVIGGADGAVKEAIFLSQFANKVTIVCVEEELSCIREFIDKSAKIENISVLPHSSLTAVRGDSEIEELEFTDLITEEKTTIVDKGAIVYTYIGLVPNTSIYNDLELENGYIVVDDNMETKFPGVFAVGDIRKKRVRQVATAVSDGAIAAINVYKLIAKKPSKKNK